MPHPLPWYVAGPLVGLMVPALLLLGNRAFGVSSNFRHICAAVAPRGLDFFKHDWRREGAWNLIFLAGIFTGALLASWLAPPPVDVSAQTVASLHQLGIQEVAGLAPPEIFSWASLLTVRGFVCVIVGGFLVGFGTAYAGGCTSGHAIAGLADLQLPSLVAVLGFFAGGLATTYIVLPWLFR
jgi:uncharacterized membrane protein YedE/YeeE